jgi:F-type H+-transporting ATPase subunit delta
MEKTNTKSIATAKKYAQALFEATKEDNNTNSVLEDIDLVYSTISNNKEIGLFLGNPEIQNEDKKGAIQEIFGNRVSLKIMNLLYIMIDNGRYDIIGETYKEFQKIINEINSVITVKATTAIEMKEYLKKELQEKIENKLSKRVNIEYETNPQIIGGLIIETDGKIIDNSIKTKLSKIKKELI